MSGGKWPAAPGGEAQTSEKGWKRTGERSDEHPDLDPPSGILLRCDALAGVPRLAISAAELKALPLDHRAGFIVSFVDGSFTVDMILDACCMRREEALAILRELATRGVITLG